MIVGVGSWRGVGATTTAMLLAATHAGRGASPWLVDADPAGGTMAPLLGLAHGAGLEEVAFGPAQVGALDRLRTVAVPVGGVQLVAGPGDPFRAAACHAPRVAWQRALRDLDGPVVVDVGSLRHVEARRALLDELDVLVIVASSDALSIATTLDWIETRGRVAPGAGELRDGVATVCVVEAPGAINPVGRAAAEVECSRAWCGWLPWSPVSVRRLLDADAPYRRAWRRDPLTAAAAAVADRLAARAGVPC